MTEKSVAEKYGVPKNTLLHGWEIISNWKLLWKRKERLLHEKAHVVGAATKQIKQFFTGLLEKEAKKIQLMGSYLKKKP